MFIVVKNYIKNINSHKSTALSTCRLGSYEITEAEGVQRGTKVVVHLKGDCYDYAKEETIKGKTGLLM